jgi:hypothetical protein
MSRWTTWRRKAPFPQHDLGITFNEGPSHEWKALTRALFVSEVHPDLSERPMSRIMIRTLPSPLFEILSIMLTGQDKIGVR